MRFVRQPGKRALSLALSASLIFQSFPANALARVSYDTQGTALAPASSTWIADQLSALAEKKEAQEAAQTKVDESNETIESLESQITTHEEAIAKAQDTVSQCQEELEEAQATANETAADLEAAQKAYDENDAAIEDTQKRIADLEKIAAGDLSEWEQAVTDAEGTLEDARSDLDDAQDMLDELEEQLASGSFGFFEYYEATGALDALNDSTYADKTQKGNADDATSLDSMKVSLVWINALNEIRSDLGLGELTVTDYLMACAQADANYSDTVMGHAEQFDVAENLAWNYGSDPFEQWYDEEKALYDEGERDFGKVGHYLNCIDPDYTVTGFAICTRRTMNRYFTYDQTFDFSGSPSFTVDEYEERIDAYVSAMEEAIADAKQEVTDAETAVSDAEEALAEARQALDDATSEVEHAAADLEDARKELAALQEKAATLQDDVEAAQKASDDAQGALTSATSSLQDAEGALEELQNDPDYLKLKDDLAAEQDALAEAEEKLAAAQNACEQITEAIKKATDLSNTEDIEIKADDTVYNGKEQRPSVRITATFPDGSQQDLVEGTDYSVAYANNVNVGTATVTVLPIQTGELGQWWSSGKGSFGITPKAIETTEAQPIDDQVFTGSAIKPKVELTDGTYNLQEDVDYTLSYSDNTNAGEATVEVKGAGNYAGTIDLPFTIVAADLAGVTVDPIPDQTLSGGKALTPKPVVKLGSYTLREGSDYTLSYTDNTKVGTATVAITAKEGGNVTGSTTATFKIVATPHIAYRTHVQNVGWQSYVRDGSMSGTSGRSLRLEGINIRLEGAPYSGGIRYRTHVQNIGWQDWKYNDAMSGTSGRSLRLEAIQIELTGEMSEHYDVWYRVHAQNFGWMGWARNGVSAGSATYGYRLEGIEVVILPKGSAAPGSTSGAFRQHLVQYQTHVQNVGWQGWSYDGGTSGTSGQSLRLEGINIQLPSQLYTGGIRYRTHVQNVGWQGWKSNGAMSGTSGRSLRLEAIEIELYGQMAERFDVWYRVHSQNFGWMGWTKNGQSAGTAGYAYRLEGIQIALLPKGSNAPGNTANAFRQK